MRRITPMVDMTRELVRQAIDGDREAFSELMRVSASRQYAIASLILRDRSRAQDVVQEAFVAAWKGISALREPDAEGDTTNLYLVNYAVLEPGPEGNLGPAILKLDVGVDGRPLAS